MNIHLGPGQSRFHLLGIAVFSILFGFVKSSLNSRNVPEGSTSRTVVLIRVKSLEVEDLDAFKMEMKVRFDLEQSLSRVQVNGSNINTNDSDLNWSSEVRIENGREVSLSRSEWRLDRTGRQYITLEKIAVRFGCPLDFSSYPFDHQRCHIELRFANESIQYKLKTQRIEDSRNFGEPLPNHVHFDSQIFISPFSIAITSITNQNPDFSNEDPNSKFFITVHIRRNYGAYFGSYFLPVSSFVFISLLTLWLVYPKISVIVNFFNIILLNIYLAMLRNHSDIPKVYYTTAMSVYSCTAIIFIVTVLLVNVYVLYYIKSEEEDDEERARRRRVHDLNIRNDIKFIPPSSANTSNHISTISTEEDFSPRRSTGQSLSTWVLVKRKILDRIRRNSHWALLITYLLFNFVFWITMLCIHYLQ